MAMTPNIIETRWTNELAYAIGLITSDGNLSPDQRHIAFTSKDEDLANLFHQILKLKSKIGKKARGGEQEKKYFVVQFSSVNFYNFLLSIGLTSNKSKTLGPLLIPELLFMDFLRGCIDGDGSISEFKHPESKNLQLRVRLCSGSLEFLKWIKENIDHLIDTQGGWIYRGKRVYNLAYGTEDSIKILGRIYPSNTQTLSLQRKRIVAEKYIKTKAGMAKLVRRASLRN